MSEEKSEGAEASQPAPEPAPPAAEGVLRTTRFRRGLLTKLPRLEYHEWTVKDDFDLNDEWAAGGAVRSDAILGPLEPLAPDYLR